jgi:uncharacterized protein (DUF1778 family)
MEKETKTLSAHFANKRAAALVLRAAKRAGKSPSQFIRDAALAAAMQCPTCGQVHKKTAA